jgi:hypothetical protein
MTKKPLKPDSTLETYYDSVLGDISKVIDAARSSAARSVNYIMTTAYWLIGRRIVESEQKREKRAAYGEELLKKLSVDLGKRFGRGFGVDNLQRFRAFYLTYPSERIYATLSSNLPDEDQTGKYTIQLRISGKQPTVEPDGSIFQTLSGILQTVPAESALSSIASSFPLPCQEGERGGEVL